MVLLILTHSQPRNLFLIDYYKTHDLVTSDEFKDLWDGLISEQRMVCSSTLALVLGESIKP